VTVKNREKLLISGFAEIVAMAADGFEGRSNGDLVCASHSAAPNFAWTAAALQMRLRNPDQNDAVGLAQVVRTGWYRSVHVKSLDAHQARSLLGARAQLVGMRTRLSNMMRGVLKTFGLLPGADRILRFDRRIEAMIEDTPEVALIVRPVPCHLAASPRADSRLRRCRSAPREGGRDLQIADDGCPVDARLRRHDRRSQPFLARSDLSELISA
jgi:hypothetical protein